MKDPVARGTYIHPSKPVVSDWELHPLTKISVTWCLRHWALLWWFLVGAADTSHTSHRWRARYKGVGWREWYPRNCSKKTGMQEPHWNFLPTVDEDLVYVRWRYQRWISNLHCMILSIESVVFTTRHHSPRRRPKWTSQRPERVETFGTFKELGYVWSWLVNQPPLII